MLMETGSVFNLTFFNTASDAQGMETAEKIKNKSSRIIRLTDLGKDTG